MRLRLTEFFTLPPHLNLHPEIAQHFRRNFLCNAADMVVFLFGVSFASVATILPVYARRLTDSPIVFGLIPALVDAGWFLPQLFMAPLVERLPRKLPLVIWLGAIERVPFAVLPVAVLWLAGLPGETAALLFLALIAWRALGSGVVATPWQEMLAKVIPVTHRGRMFGGAHFVGQLLGVGGSAIAFWLLDALPYPQNFAVSFGAGAVGIWLSLAFLFFVKEPALPPSPHNSRLDRAYARRLLDILRTNLNFRTYVISRWFSYFGFMAAGFFAVYAVTQFDLPDSSAAIFSGILLGASVVGYAVWGPIGDRLGHKHVLELTTLLWLAALAAALLSEQAWGFYLVFALMGLANSGGSISDLNLGLEFGPEADRPTYIGLLRTVTGPALLIAPVFGGWLAGAFSYPAVFGAAFGFALIGLGLLRFRVTDPRHLIKE